MLLHELLGKRQQADPKDTITESQRFLLKGGYVKPLASGIFSLFPLARRVCAKIEAIIREEMNAIQAQEITLPVVMPREIWDESGRYASIGKEMVRFKDRAGHDLLLGMTHEEAVVDLVRNEISSYRDLPFCAYQIQTKFRDEPRPRAGLLRVREFLMKDAYSFHADLADLERYYAIQHAAYERIFQRVGIRDLAIVESDLGMMGGIKAHEFMLVSAAGEDTLVICASCGLSANKEVLAGKETEKCPVCSAQIELKRGIELGNIFQLGDLYTKSMGVKFTKSSGETAFPLMGCYGIGVGRLMASIIEQSHDKYGPIWPEAVAPFLVHICALQAGDEEVTAAARSIYQELEKSDAILDISVNSSGTKFAEADLVGAPVRITVSTKSLQRGVVELQTRNRESKVEAKPAEVAATVKKLIERQKEKK